MSARHIRAAGVAIVGALTLAVSAFFLTVQTRWFQTKLQSRVVAAIENATGARVDLDAVRFNPHTGSIELSNVVLHGTEPAGSAPLFTAPSIQAGIKLSSLLRPKLNLASVTIHHPQVSVIIAADGSTNLPVPHAGNHSMYQEFWNLGVDRFELDHASLRLNDQSIRFDAKGRGLKLVWTRSAAADQSRVSLASNDVVVQYGDASPASFDMNLSAELSHDRIHVTSVSLKTGASRLEANGSISHLARPNARFNVHAELAAQDLARTDMLPNLSGGSATVTGQANYAPESGFAFDGKLRGGNLVYRARRFAVRNINVQSDVNASGTSGIELRNLVVTSPLAKLKGAAAVSKDRNFSMNASVTAANIQKLALATTNNIPWSGLASGSLSVTGRMTGSGLSYLTAKTSANITPAPGGIPISGEIRASLNSPGRISFEDSQVNLPGTQISFSGVPNSNLQLVVSSSHLDDLMPVFSLAGFERGAEAISQLGSDANGSFQGSIAGPLADPIVQGELALQHFYWLGKTWNRAHSNILFTKSGLTCGFLTLNDGALHGQADGRLGLVNWRIQPDNTFQLNARLEGLDVNRLSVLRRSFGSIIASGKASAILNLRGSLQNPAGTAQLSAANLDADGQHFESLHMDASLAAGSVNIDHGRIQSGPATLAFSGAYKHLQSAWSEGQLSLRLDTNPFPLKTIASISRRLPEISAEMEAHGDVTMSLSATEVRPVRADGTLFLRGIAFSGKRLGTVLIKSQTSEKEMTATLSGDLQESALRGTATVQLTSDLPLRADAQFGKLDIRAVSSLLGMKPEFRNAMTGFMDGTISVSGPLEDPRLWHSKLQLATLQMKPDAASLPSAPSSLSDLVFQNAGPVVIESNGGIAAIRNLHIKGKDTSLSANGSFDLLNTRPADVKLNGKLDLRTLAIFDPRLEASGESELAAAVSGSLANPAIDGTLRITNGSFSFQDVTNGLRAVNGTIRFNRDRATIQTLTAESGGGTLRLGGFVSFGAPGMLVYGLTARADKVRLRYAGGISVTADADLQLSGSSNTSLLSGTATVSRIVLSANTDIGNVFANFAAPTPAPANQKDFVSGLHFDVAVQSAANLELNTTLSRNLETDIDLHLRGTPDHPILLGSVTANQGDIRVFGTRYTLNRGEVSFVNTVKIEPVLDVDLETETRGITVDITIAGTLNKLNITYRSDPPLQPRDIIALLAIGRAPSDVTTQESAQVSSEASQLQSGAYSALGQAMSPNSSRLSKLFGVTTIKIDPLVQGIAYNQARLTLEEQLSRDVTVTYVTNLAQTAEQIFRVEWALNRQFSVVAVRDDNGMFGLDFLIKRSFK